MKIEIITLGRSYNFGAFLQAFALQNFLKTYDLNNKIIDLGQNNKVKFIYVKSKNIKKVFNNLIQLKYFERDTKLLNFCKNKEEKFDFAIVGSDEIWNVHNNSFIHHDEFFGYHLNSDKIISYAPSCNNIIACELQKYNSNYDFRNVDLLSVRDLNTQRLVKEITGEKVPIVLDPTFLLDSYDKYIIYPNEKNYIAVYGYEFTNEQINEIKNYASCHNLKTISLGLYNSWCDKNVKIGAFEFLGYIKNASFVFTSTFHGTIFSLILEKQFITFSNNKQKIKYLLQQFEISENDFTNKSIDNWSNKLLDYKKINKIKVKLKQQSIEYLNGALNINE